MKVRGHFSTAAVRPFTLITLVLLILSTFASLGIKSSITSAANNARGDESFVKSQSQWSSSDIGDVGISGSESAQDDIFTVSGSGAGIAGKSDGLHYLYQPMSGDGEMVARVINVEATSSLATAGIMIRDTLDPAASYGSISVTAKEGILFQYRKKTRSTSSVVSTLTSVTAQPTWIGLSRTGRVVSAYVSDDGIDWTLIGETKVNFAPDVYIGLAVSSYDNSVATTSQFDKVSIRKTNGVIQSLTINPLSLIAGDDASLEVTMSAPAPPDGTLVSLSCDNAAVSVPASVTIAEGQTSTIVPIRTQAAASQNSLTIKASLGISSKTATAALVTSSPGLSSLTVNPISVAGGGVAQGTLALTTPAPRGGTVVSLSTSDAAVATVPPSVVVNEGSNFATFPISTKMGFSNSSISISGSSGGVTRSAILTVGELAESGTTLSSLTISPASVLAGDKSKGTVILSRAAPAGGAQVVLSNSDPVAAEVPAVVTVPAGSTSAIFKIRANSVSSTSVALITAGYGGVSKSGSISINAGRSITLASLTLASTNVVGGGVVQGSVTLSSPATSGGVVVALSSDNPAASVPAHVAVPEGALSATFNVNTVTSTLPASATISANLGGSTLSSTVTVGLLPATLAALALNPSTITGGITSTGTVTLNVAAATGGSVVSLSSNSSFATVPATVTVPAGSLTANFNFTTRTVTVALSLTITAACNGVSKEAILTLNPASGDTTPPVISAVASSGITASAATIAWTTNEGSDTQVEYGPTTSYGSSSPLATPLVTSHSISLSGLTAGTTYNYRVKSRDAAGNLGVSGNFTFTSAAASGSQYVEAETGVLLSPMIVGSDPLASGGQFVSAGTQETGTATYNVTVSSAGTYYLWGRVLSPNDSSDSFYVSIDGAAEQIYDSAQGVWSTNWQWTQVRGRDASGQPAQVRLTFSGAGNHTVKFRGRDANTKLDRIFITNDPNAVPSGSTPQPPVISAVSSSGLTSSGATISWTTNVASDSQVEYGTTTAYGSSATLNTSMVTSHSQALSGLSGSTLYHYRVRSRDAAGNLGTSADFTFTTTAASDTTPPVISGVSTSGLSSSGATVSWTTNEASNTQVEYGPTTAYGSSSTLNTSMVTSHSQALSGLSGSTLYHYRVKSRDAAGNLATSADFTFTTTAAADTTPPVISGVSTSGVSSSGATVSWTTNEASNTQVEYGTTTAYGSSSTLNTSMVTSHSQALTGLSASTLYHYRVKSRDAAGNLATSADFTFTTTAAPDTTPPVISGVSSSGISVSGATITWSTNEPSDTQVDYGLTTSYGSSTALNTSMVTSHSASVSGLLAATLYHYRVKSRDAAGNLATSADFTVLTLTLSDTTPPVISSVSSSGVSASGATITWSTNELSDTQVDYGTTTSYGSSSTLNGSLVTSHSVSLSGLNASTLYHYRVKSRDAAGNLATSGDFSLTTSAGTQPSGNFFVAINGSDTNPGTSALPFRTIGRGIRALSSGQTLIVKAGTYAEFNVGGTDTVAPGTSWASPTTIKANPGDTVVIQPTAAQAASKVVLFTNPADQYIVVDGFVLDGQNVTSDAVKITAGATHIRIKNCEIKNAPNQGVIISATMATFVEVIGCNIHNNGAPGNQTHQIYISKASNNLIQGCTLHDGPSHGVQIWKDPSTAGCDNNTVSNTIAYNLTRGIGVYGGANNLVYNCVTYNNGFGIYIRNDSGDLRGVQIYNNTVYNNASSGIGIQSDSAATTARNNIAFQNGDGNLGDHTGRAIMSNNLVGINPLFVSISAGNFHLAIGSPAINTGMTIGVVTTDMDGVARPQGGAYDIGAYER